MLVSTTQQYPLRGYRPSSKYTEVHRRCEPTMRRANNFPSSHFHPSLLPEHGTARPGIGHPVDLSNNISLLFRGSGWHPGTPLGHPPRTAGYLVRLVHRGDGRTHRTGPWRAVVVIPFLLTFRWLLTSLSEVLRQEKQPVIILAKIMCAHVRGK